MRLKKDIIEGTRFGLLTYLKDTGKENGATTALFVCDCGVHRNVRATSVFNGYIISCPAARCRKSAIEGLENTVKILQEKIISLNDEIELINNPIREFKSYKEKKLYEYWDYYESGKGTLAGIEEGHRKTRDFLRIK